MMSHYEEIIENTLEKFDIKGLRVLDAGSGRISARMLIQRSPLHLTCVCAPQDKFKLDSVFNELGGDRDDTYVLGTDLSEPGIFPDESFDFILADHLIGEIDIFAPGKHIDVLTALHKYLSPSGNLVIIDTEPDHPELKDPQSIISQKKKEIGINKTIPNEPDNITRYRLYTMIRRLLFEIAVNNSIRGFMTIPGDWVEKWLKGIGFKHVNPELAFGIIEVEVDDEAEQRSRAYLSMLTDEKLRKYIEALLDRTEGLLRETSPFDIEQDVYIISCGKE